MLRLDYWLDGGALLGLGFLEATEIQNHQSLMLIASVNQDLVMELEGKSERISMILLDSRVDYRILKGEDWQFFAYIPENTRLGMILRESLKGQKSLVFLREEEPQDWLSPFITDYFDDFQAEELLHLLLKKMVGIFTYPQNWSPDLNGIQEILQRGYWNRLSIASLAEELELSAEIIRDLFFKLAGVPLDMYLYHRRVGEAFKRINRDWDTDKACRESGLAGINAASDYFRMNFNLSLTDLLEQKPAIRFMAGPMNRLYGYRMSSESSDSDFSSS